MTNWNPYIGATDSWLLSSGAIAQAPKIEATDSLRRFRLADNPDAAVWKKDLPGVILQAVIEAAELEEDRVIAALGKPAELAENFEALADVSITSPTLPPETFTANDGSVNTEAIWHFKHPNLPLHIVLKAALRQRYRSCDVDWNIYANTIFASHDDIPSEEPRLVSVIQSHSDLSQFVVSHYRNHQTEKTDMIEWLESAAPPWLASLTDIDVSSSSPRESVESMLRIINLMEDFSEIQFPIAPTQTFETLELVKTNVNEQLIADIKDYVDGAPIAAELRDYFTKIRNILSSRGINMGDVDESTVATALSGQPQVLDVTLSNQNDRDYDHAVTINVLTGEVKVACTSQVDTNALQQWEVALLKAELEGRKDEFLNFYRDQTSESLADHIRKHLND